MRLCARCMYMWPTRKVSSIVCDDDMQYSMYQKNVYLITLRHSHLITLSNMLFSQPYQVHAGAPQHGINYAWPHFYMKKNPSTPVIHTAGEIASSGGNCLLPCLIVTPEVLKTRHLLTEAAGAHSHGRHPSQKKEGSDTLACMAPLDKQWCMGR